MQKENTIIKGSLFLAIGAFVSKLLGALYRIPLLNLITTKGVGLYQMVFPVYCILLDFAGVGAPNAIAKLIAKQENEKRDFFAKRYLNSSLSLFFVLGLIFSLLMLVLSKPLSILQGDENAYLGYIFLSPSVLFVALISCYRGYFQGKLQMLPTSISQIIEQAVKLCLGLFFAYLFMPNVYLAVGGATLAVSISEAVALFYLFIKYKKQDKFGRLPVLLAEKRQDKKSIISLTIPLTLIGIAIPFSNLTDSFFIVNILNKYNKNATALYGIYSGATMSIINLPVSLCYGISVVLIPLLSGEKDSVERNKKIKTAILLTLAVSIPFALCTFGFSGVITRILYRNMSLPEKNVTVNLIKITSVNVIFLSLLQTQNSILISNEKNYFPLLSMGIGIVVKTIISVILLNNPSFNIYGAGVGLIACYFVAVLVNFIMIIKSNKTCRLKVLKSAIS